MRQRDLYRDCTADRSLLIVLDNAHSDAQVLLLPASPDCLVLVTSRRRLDRLVAETGARPLTLPPLSTPDSVRLLTRIVRREPTADVTAGVLRLLGELAHFSMQSRQFQNLRTCVCPNSA